MKIDSEKTIAHLKKRLVETALNNIGFNEDVYLDIADHRIETWVNEVPAAVVKPNKIDDLISRQWLVECVTEGWIKFDTEKDENKFIHLVRDTAPAVQRDRTEGGKND